MRIRVAPGTCKRKTATKNNHHGVYIEIKFSSNDANILNCFLSLAHLVMGKYISSSEVFHMHSQKREAIKPNTISIMYLNNILERYFRCYDTFNGLGCCYEIKLLLVILVSENIIF